MKPTVVLLAGTLAASALPAAAQSPQLTQDDMRQAAESFYSIELDPARAYLITRAHLKRDQMRIDLEGGTLVLAKPILGRITGACYRGQAKLSLTPPNPIEKAALRTQIGSETFQATVDGLYLRFNDHTVDELTSGLEPATSADTGFCTKLFSQRNYVVRRYEGQTVGFSINFEADFLESLLSPAILRDFFLLEADVKGHDWITYFQRPGLSPSVRLGHMKPVGILFDPETWTYYDLTEEKRSTRLMASLDIIHNKSEIVIPNISSFTLDSTIDWKAPVEVSSVRFSMINSYAGSTWNDAQAKPVTIESITDANGASLPFVHRRHEVLVALPAPVPAGQVGKFRVRAKEDTILQATPETFSLLNTYPWFPQESGYLGGEYTFDWIVKVRRPMIAAGSGTTVREWVEKDKKLNCAQWKSDVPLPFPSLIFGKYRKIEDEYTRDSDGSTVKMRLFYTPNTTFSNPETFETFVFRVPSSKPKHLLRDVSSILNFYEQVLGPYPHDEIDIAQMAPFQGYAQAPPGLVQITGDYFFSQSYTSGFISDPRYTEFMRTVLAHEIAHHWWGDVVRWASDKDQWLSESLAEYSSGIYLEAAEGEKMFRQALKAWRSVCERWEGALPIIHADRASGENGSDIRQALLYNKGPLVVHMLRVQLGDDKFKAALQKLLSDHAGEWIKTEDFRKVIESVAGYQMDWFFDQWIRETGIPELHFSYNVQPHEGKYLLSAQLKQSGPAEPKALFVPVSFHFKSGRGEKEWRVSKADEKLQLMLPQQPTKVMIDERGDLLVNIVYD